MVQLVVYHDGFALVHFAEPISASLAGPLMWPAQTVRAVLLYAAAVDARGVMFCGFEHHKAQYLSRQNHDSIARCMRCAYVSQAKLGLVFDDNAYRSHMWHFSWWTIEPMLIDWSDVLKVCSAHM